MSCEGRRSMFSWASPSPTINLCDCKFPSKEKSSSFTSLFPFSERLWCNKQIQKSAPSLQDIFICLIYLFFLFFLKDVQHSAGAAFAKYLNKSCLWAFSRLPEKHPCFPLALPQAVAGPFSQRLLMLAVLYLNHTSNRWENVHMESNRILQPLWLLEHLLATHWSGRHKYVQKIKQREGGGVRSISRVEIDKK